MTTGRQINAVLRITAAFESVLNGLKGVKAKVEDVNGAAKGTSTRDAFKPLQAGLTAVSDQATRVRQQLLALAGVGVGAAALRGLADLADRYSSLDARLRVATRSQVEFDTARAQSLALSRQYLQPLDETVTLYTRLLRAVIPLGGGTREAQVATEAMLAALRLNGSTAAESASAILQFSQALGAGRLAGEEFNAIAEAAGPLLDALAKGLGKPREELKSLAEQGKLTTSAVLEALTRSLPELRRQAAQIPETIGGASQRARDQFNQFVGATASGSAVIATSIGVIKLLGDNIETIVAAVAALVVGMGALKLASFAQGLYVAGAAAAAGATGIAALGLALRGVVALMTGPVGLIVLVGSLAAAWLGLDKARQKTQERTIERVRAERDAVAAELQRLRAENLKTGVWTTGQARGEVYLADRRLARLDDELKGLQRKAFEDARRADKGTYADQASTDLRDPRTVKEFEGDYPTRLAVAKKFADERAAYVIAKDRDIAQARATGDLETERKLTREKGQFLAQQAKAEADALKKFDQDSTVTRLAQVREHYDQREELLRDALARELKLNEEAFADGLRDAQTYLRERARLNDEQARRDVQALEAQLLQARTAYEANLRLPTRGLDANQRAERRDALSEQAEKVARLEADIERRKRDQVDAQRELLRDSEQLTREIERQRTALDVMLAEAQGAPLSSELIRRKVQAQFEEVQKQAKRLGLDQGQVLKLIDLEVTRQELGKLEREFARVYDSLQLREQAIAQEVTAHRITSADAERQVVQLRREEVRLLDEILAKAAALANSPEEKARIERYRQQVQGVGSSKRAPVVDLEETAYLAAISSISTALNDLTTGAKRGKDALLDMVRSFSVAMLDALNKRLAQQLVDGAIAAFKSFTSNIGSSAGSTGGSGGGYWAAIASWIASFFHQGGVVGEGGGMRRAVPAAAFAGAPRYHLGGIAGLGSNEVPAVLLRGEEVLTRDDPRHRDNMRRSAAGPAIGAVNVSVTVDGAGDAGSQLNGARLGQALRIGVLTVLEEEMRPGGSLQHVQRG